MKIEFDAGETALMQKLGYDVEQLRDAILNLLKGRLAHQEAIARLTKEEGAGN